MQNSSWEELLSTLNLHRQRVMKLFDEHMSLLNLDVIDAEKKITVAGLQTKLEEYSSVVYKNFTELFKSRHYKNLNDATQKTLVSLVSLFLDEIELHHKSNVAEIESATLNFLKIIRAIGRRAVYYSLLVEMPAALKHLLEVCFASEYLCEQIALRPILLDELLDARIFSVAPRADDIRIATINVFNNSKKY